MRYYETIYIVDPNLENLVLDKTMDEISKELEKTESKLINHRIWGMIIYSASPNSIFLLDKRH